LVSAREDGDARGSGAGSGVISGAEDADGARRDS
jgi:hypothetical protein